MYLKMALDCFGFAWIVYSYNSLLVMVNKQ